MSSSFADAFRLAGVVSSSNLFEAENALVKTVINASKKLFDLGMYRSVNTKNRLPGCRSSSKNIAIYKPFSEESKIPESYEVSVILIPTVEWFRLISNIELPVMETCYYSENYMCVSVDDFCRVVNKSRKIGNHFDLVWEDSPYLVQKSSGSVLVRVM